MHENGCFQNSPKIQHTFGYFCKKICYQYRCKEDYLEYKLPIASLTLPTYKTSYSFTNKRKHISSLSLSLILEYHKNIATLTTHSHSLSLSLSLSLSYILPLSLSVFTSFRYFTFWAEPNTVFALRLPQTFDRSLWATPLGSAISITLSFLKQRVRFQSEASIAGSSNGGKR